MEEYSQDDPRYYLKQALKKYSEGDYYSSLLEAKKEYFSLTGQVNEDDSDFEMRMSSFNDWYLLQFIAEDGEVPLIKDFLSQVDLSEEEKKELKSPCYSLFRHEGLSLRKKVVLKDILHDKKVTLNHKDEEISLCKGDLFVGRTMDFKGGTFLLEGLVLIPSDVLSSLKKQSKKIRKLNDEKEEYHFLLQIEMMKTKWKRYGHVDPKHIFQFS